ncbi:(2Fe-2S)-binding protein [Mesorhizobium sp. B2-3-5]|uniref:(2Fe-2S)-binding protein n=1 Tax=Mesorhizobium sp. B2-3-5 TaxID=2589958 RepID=UPI001128A4C8|nr:(2Fe-2S)-binding protein [Mesorhizobium sp. B2-3-5]TPM24808.1 (2Fe-2S)-binding protein [Mesorhizobium sp. B2-3-5]
MATVTINGTSHTVRAAPDTPLLYVLRNELKLNAAKFGCGLGQCGACTVIVEGEAVFSCVTPVELVDGRAVTTLEGLGTREKPGVLQQAFIDEQAVQCGYCIPGMMMRAQALLQRNPRVSDRQIREELEPHLCRCGTHMRILRAIRRAADRLVDQATSAGTGGRS